MMDQLQGSGVSTWGTDSRRYMTQEVIEDISSTFRYAGYHNNQGMHVSRYADSTSDYWLTLPWADMRQRLEMAFPSFKTYAYKGDLISQLKLMTLPDADKLLENSVWVFNHAFRALAQKLNLSNDISEVDGAQQAEAVKLFLKFLRQKGKPYTPIVDRIRTRAAQPTTIAALCEDLTESLTHWQQTIRFVDEAIGRKTTQRHGGGDEHK